MLTKDQWLKEPYLSQWSQIAEANEDIVRLSDQALKQKWLGLYSATRSVYQGGHSNRAEVGQSNEFKSWKSFLALMGFRPFPSATLNRRDNGKGYYPDNVVWADKQTQSLNRGCVDPEKQPSLRLWPKGKREVWEREYQRFRTEHETRQLFMLRAVRERMEDVLPCLINSPSNDHYSRVVRLLDYFDQARRCTRLREPTYYRLLDLDQREDRKRVKQLVELFERDREYAPIMRPLSVGDLGGLKLTHFGWIVIQALDTALPYAIAQHLPAGYDQVAERPEFDEVTAEDLDRWRYPSEPKIVVHHHVEV